MTTPGDLARKDRLISSLKRQLRASNGMGGKNHSRTTSGANSHSGARRLSSSSSSSDDPNDFDSENDLDKTQTRAQTEDDMLLALHAQNVTQHNEQLGRMGDLVE